MVFRYLKKWYTVFESKDGIEALEVMENEAIDLVILDLMMPCLDGEGFIKTVRKISDVYVIVLTAKTGEDSQLSLYELGADDYVEKPFSGKVLTSKVSAVIARLSQKVYGQDVVQIEGLTFDNTARKICVYGKDCKFKPKEYDLLQFLIRNPNLALSREQILNEVWGADCFGGDRTVDSHISNLRRKLSRFGVNIATINSYGYKWEVRK